MTSLFEQSKDLLWQAVTKLSSIPIWILILGFLATVLLGIIAIYLLVLYLAPYPRGPYQSEKTYFTTAADGTIINKQLPCWHDEWLAHRHEAESLLAPSSPEAQTHTGTIDAPSLEISIVVPAYNEEQRIEVMLEEAVEYLDRVYGRAPDTSSRGGSSKKEKAGKRVGKEWIGGYEILVVDDGSKDKTVDVVLEFSRRNKLHDVLRISKLEQNRGKGGAVTHGFRHVRGAYVAFVDADGASKFSDMGKLVEGCDAVSDQPGRGVAVGSRAHMVSSEAVVKRSLIRNFLMHSFHLLLRILTPPATSRIRDTQCGFKLFTRASLPHIVPYMHAEGWIFDVEMLLLAESAPEGVVLGSEGMIGTTPGIRVAEVPVGWKEVGGSKLNVVRDSLLMAWGLALLRASWMFGVYRRR